MSITFSKKPQRVSTQYVLLFIDGQRELPEALQLVVRAPHGVVGAEHNALCADFPDKLRRVLRGEGVQAAGEVGVDDASGEQLGGFVPLSPAGEVSADYRELREALHDAVQPLRRGIIVTRVPAVEQYRKPALGGFVDRERLRVVDVEPLEVGVQLYSAQPEGDYSLSLTGDVGEIWVERSESDELLRVEAYLLRDEIVDVADLLGYSRPPTALSALVDAGFAVYLEKLPDRAVEPHRDIVEAADAVGGAGSYLVREYVCVCVYYHFCVLLTL